MADRTKPTDSTKREQESKSGQQTMDSEAPGDGRPQDLTSPPETSVVDAVKNAGKKLFAKAAQVGAIATSMSPSETSSSSPSSSSETKVSDQPVATAKAPSRNPKTAGANRTSPKTGGAKTTRAKAAATKPARKKAATGTTRAKTATSKTTTSGTNTVGTNTVGTKTVGTNTVRTNTAKSRATKKKNPSLKSAAKGSAPTGSSSNVTEKGSTLKTPSTTLPAPYQVGAEARQKMIEDAAYFIAEKRNFIPGFEDQDWLAAEALIDRLIKETVPNPNESSGANSQRSSDSSNLGENNSKEMTTNG